jgi:hypothetical protein
MCDIIDKIFEIVNLFCKSVSVRNRNLEVILKTKQLYAVRKIKKINGCSIY